MQILMNRLIKKNKHLAKWAKRNHISVFRVYHKEIPEYPLTVDWVDGNVVAWWHERTRDDTEEKMSAYIADITQQLITAFSISPDRLFLKKRGIQKGTEKYQRLDQQQKVITIEENGLKFEINLSDYLDIGLFLDHRHHRQAIRNLSQGKRVLNLFAYTGSFTCYAIAGGAKETTTVDMSPVYLHWTERNLELNNFKSGPSHHLISEDCLQFLEKETHQYDIIICDPPTFSNSKRMKQSSFAIERDYPDLISQCERILAPSGLLLFSTNAKGFKLDPEILPKNLTITEKTTPHTSEDFKTCLPHQCWYLTKMK